MIPRPRYPTPNPLRHEPGHWFRFFALSLVLFGTNPSVANEECISLFNTGPLWSFIGLFRTPEALKRAESVRMLLSEGAVVRGKMLVGRADGTAIERYAYAIERKTGHRVILSDEANEARRARGFVRSDLPVIRKTGEETLAVVNLGQWEARGARLSLVAPHEGTHAWLSYLDSIGEGTPLSIRFFDFGMTHPGPYGTSVSAQEMKTWSQDVVRGLRKVRESEVIARFRANEKLRVGELFGSLLDASDRLRIAREIAVRIGKDLADAKASITALKDSGENQKRALDLFFETRSGETVLRMRRRVEIALAKKRAISVPLNLGSEWEHALALKAAEGDREKFAVAYRALIESFEKKIDSLAEFSRDFETRTREIEALVENLGKKKEVDRSEYFEFRRRLTDYGTFFADFARSSRTLKSVESAAQSNGEALAVPRLPRPLVERPE